MTNPKSYKQISKCYVGINYLFDFFQQVIGQLERGTVISKFYYRKRPERKMLAVRRETMFVVWYRVSSSRNMYEVLNFYICYQKICFFLLHIHLEKILRYIFGLGCRRCQRDKGSTTRKELQGLLQVARRSKQCKSQSLLRSILWF